MNNKNPLAKRHIQSIMSRGKLKLLKEKVESAVSTQNSDNTKTEDTTSCLPSEEMLGQTIYTYNKRAKEMRDEAEKYRKRSNSFYWDDVDAHGLMLSCKQAEKECYDKKKQFLSLFSPIKVQWTERFSKNRRTKVEYYLLFKVGGYIFHLPVDESTVYKEYYDLEIEHVKDFKTYSQGYSELLSEQMLDKINDQLNSNFFNSNVPYLRLAS